MAVRGTLLRGVSEDLDSGGCGLGAHSSRNVGRGTEYGVYFVLSIPAIVL